MLLFDFADIWHNDETRKADRRCSRVLSLRCGIYRSGTRRDSEFPMGHFLIDRSTTVLLFDFADIWHN